MESNWLSQRRQLRREQAALHIARSGGFRGAWTAARRRGRAEAARDAGDRGNPSPRSGSGQARADLRGNFSLRQIAECVFFTFHRAPLSRSFDAEVPPSFNRRSPTSLALLSQALNLFFRRRLSLQDVNLAGEVLEVDFRGLQDACGLAPVTDYYQQFDYLARAQMLLQPIERGAAGLDVGVHLVGELQDQAFQLAEALGALPILDCGDLLFRDSDVPGRRDVLGPFINGMAILGGPQNRNFSE